MFLKRWRAELAVLLVALALLVLRMTEIVDNISVVVIAVATAITYFGAKRAANKAVIPVLLAVSILAYPVAAPLAKSDRYSDTPGSGSNWGGQNAGPVGTNKDDRNDPARSSTNKTAKQKERERMQNNIKRAIIDGTLAMGAAGAVKAAVGKWGVQAVKGAIRELAATGLVASAVSYFSRHFLGDDGRDSSDDRKPNSPNACGCRNSSNFGH